MTISEALFVIYFDLLSKLPRRFTLRIIDMQKIARQQQTLVFFLSASKYLSEVRCIAKRHMMTDLAVINVGLSLLFIIIRVVHGLIGVRRHVVVGIGIV